MNQLLSLTAAQLNHAADLKNKIEALHAELAGILGSAVSTASKSTGKPVDKPAKKGMSAAGRAKVAAAQKARWAKIKSAKPAVTVKPKRTMSAEGRAKIAAAAKARWAKAKAEGKTTL